METIVVVMVALAMSGLALVASVGWWLHRAIQSESDVLRGAAEAHSRTLASVSMEVHNARREVLRVTTQVETLRAELEAFAHGPPSLRQPFRPSA